MRIFQCCLLILCLAAPAAWPLSGPAVTRDNVKARLVAETRAIGPGQTMWVALVLDIRAGWHTYWQNPGDSGLPTQVDWTLPPGFKAGAIVWPTPHRFEVPPLVNYGYAGQAVHLIPLTAPPDLGANSRIPLAAKASWLVCADVCIPEDAELNLELPVAAGANGVAGTLDPTDAALFAAARAQLPTPAPAAVGARIDSGHLVLTLGREWGSTLSQIDSLTFFPTGAGAIDNAAPQLMTQDATGLELSVKLGDQPPQREVAGVLVAKQRGAEPATVALYIAAPVRGASAAPNASHAELPELLLLALAGGLILNLMPCVFPVLSIKAISLVEQAKKQPAAVRAKGLMFAAGVVSSMLILAALLLLLRAGGEEIGWGFQLQSPLFVTLMVYLLLAVGLNLSGVFEVGGGLAGVGDGLTRGDSYHAAFFTGVLTTLVATPCTAPFMAAAVGAALSQSAGVALAIFASLGLGLSLPFVLISFAPWLRRALPKPGAWMDTLKQLFAFPMYASAAWLLWVLAQQTSSLGLAAALAGAILIALAAWTYQRSNAGGRGRFAARMAAVIALSVAIVLPWRVDAVAGHATTALDSGGANGGAAVEEDAWQPYDAAKLADLDAAGRPVLVNFTASWCLTCLVNERNAFADSRVRADFHAKRITLMKGDWTNSDPAITHALAAFGRAGVPLYLLYNGKPGSGTAGGSPPLVLPQLLTATIVHEALAGIPDRGT